MAKPKGKRTRQQKQALGLVLEFAEDVPPGDGPWEWKWALGFVADDSVPHL